MAKRTASSSHGGGFSVDAGVRIEAADRVGLVRLLRYCACPPASLLRRTGTQLVTACGGDGYGAVVVVVEVGGPGGVGRPEPPAKPKPRPPAHYLWAALITRIYEVFPLLCPTCGGQMRIIAFIRVATAAPG